MFVLYIHKYTIRCYYDAVKYNTKFNTEMQWQTRLSTDKRHPLHRVYCEYHGTLDHFDQGLIAPHCIWVPYIDG